MGKEARLEFKVKGEQADIVVKAFSLSARESMVRSAWYQAFKRRNEYAVGSDLDDVWVKDVLDDAVIVRWDSKLLSYPYEINEEMEVVFGEPVGVVVVYQPVGDGGKGVRVWRRGDVRVVDNALKAIAKTETELRAGNYLALWGGADMRDLEGIGSQRKNGDGSIGEYFTSKTVFESDYTAQGRLMVDFDHGLGMTGDGDDLKAPGQDDVLGYVDWSTAKVDKRGLWVERVLNRRNSYMEWLETLIEEGLIGTSSEPVEDGVEKGLNGEIVRWPLKRDSLTVTPMEWRMMTENPLVAQAVKALLNVVPGSSDSEPVPEADAGVSDTEGAEDGQAEAARAAAVAAARVKVINIQLEED